MAIQKRKVAIVFLIFAFIIVIAIYTTVNSIKSSNLVREGFEDITKSDTIGSLISTGKIAFDPNMSTQDKVNQLKSTDIPDDVIKQELADDSKTPDLIIPLIQQRLAEIAKKYMNK